MNLARKLGLVVCTASLAPFLGAQVSESSAPVSGGKQLTLTPGSCVTVSTGDVLTFDWNPAFERPDSVTGLDNLSLLFLRKGSSLHDVSARRTGITLSAVPPRSEDPREASAPASLGNGFYRIRLLVNLHSAEAGDYLLAETTAQPRMAGDPSGAPPQMTNDPVGSYFCINVATAAHADRRSERTATP